MQTMPHGTGTSSQTAVQDAFDTPPVPAAPEPLPQAQRRPSRLAWWPAVAGVVVVAVGGAVVGSRYVDHKVNALAGRTVQVTVDSLDGYTAAQDGNYEQAIAKLEPLAITSLGQKSMTAETRARIVDTLLKSLINSNASAADHAKVMPELIKTIDERLDPLGARQEQLAWWYVYTGDAGLASARFSKAAALYNQRFQRPQAAAAQVRVALTVLTEETPNIDKAVGFLQNAAAADPDHLSLAGFVKYLDPENVNKDEQLARLARTYPLFRTNTVKAQAAVAKLVAAK